MYRLTLFFDAPDPMIATSCPGGPVTVARGFAGRP
jgi:hypothetical protein